MLIQYWGVSKMPVPINPSGASGTISNIFASLSAQVGAAARGGIQSAVEEKQFHESEFNKRGLFSPLATLKNVLGDNITDEDVLRWRNASVEQIENMRPALGYVFFGDNYFQFLEDKRLRDIYKVKAAAGGEKEFGEQRKWFVAQRDAGKKGLKSAMSEEGFDVSAHYRKQTGLEFPEKRLNFQHKKLWALVDELGGLRKDYDKEKDMSKKHVIQEKMDKVQEKANLHLRGYSKLAEGVYTRPEGADIGLYTAMRDTGIAAEVAIEDIAEGVEWKEEYFVPREKLMLTMKALKIEDIKARLFEFNKTKYSKEWAKTASKAEIFGSFLSAGIMDQAYEETWKSFLRKHKGDKEKSYWDMMNMPFYKRMEDILTGPAMTKPRTKAE